MDFRFTAHNPETGAFLHRLPRAEQVQIGDTFGTRGTLELTFSAKTLNAKPMPTFVEIRQEATFDGGQTWAQIGPNYLRLSGSHEDTDQAGMRTVKFVSREWLLGKARVGNGDLPLIDGKRPFYQASPGEIMRALLLEAKDRGAAQGIEIGGFTASKDSSGNAWSKVATIYYQPSLPILSVLENLVEQGMCDYRLEGNTLHLFEPETTMGRDLTTGGNPVRVHGAVTEAPISYTLEDLTNSALLIGEDGFKLEVDNPTAPDDYGRLEVTIEQGGVSDSGTARLMVDEALQRGSREIREITRTQKAEGLKHLPYRDYRVGDYLQVRDLGEWQRYRVREIQAVRDGDGWTVHTVINDRLQELLLKLAKRTSGIVNGSTGSGGDGTQPAPPAKPGIEPAAPQGLVINQQVYLDRQGVARGAVTAGWGEVTHSTKGEAIEIGGYELWWRENETLAVWRRASSVVDSLTVTHSPVVLSDTFGNAMEYQWRVRAVAEASARPGPWSDIITLTMTQDTTAPNTPSMPTVSTELRIITVAVDGLDEFGEAMPVDFNHSRIYFATSANMADAVQVGTLSQPGSWNSETMAPDVPVYVAVSAVDNVGNESPMTASQEVTPKKLVDDDSIRDALDDAKVDAIEEAVTTAGGRKVHNKTTPPVNSPDDKAFDVWQQWTTLEEGATLVGAWMHDGTTWVERDTTEEYVPRIHIGEGTFGVMSGQRIEANSVTADKMIIGSGGNIIPWSQIVAGATFAPHVTTSAATALLAPADPSRTLPPHLQLEVTNTTTMGAAMSLWAADGQKLAADAGAEYVFQLSVYAPEGAAVEIALYAYDHGGSSTGSNSGIFARSGSVTVGTSPETLVARGSVPAGAYYMVPFIRMVGPALIGVSSPDLRKATGSVLIEDGAIIAPKIAALAIEADHISANAITADKIRAGAIDGKLITGARIRTAASGRRTELDVEGLKSYDSSGNTVLTTQTSDGSIDMRGNLRRVVDGVEVSVGDVYSGVNPGIRWEPLNKYYAYNPGIVYSEDTGKDSLFLQGPGSSAGYSYLSLRENGESFAISAVSGNGSWGVRSDAADGYMSVGSTDGSAPYMSLRKGTGTTGQAWFGYNHPTNDGYATLALRDRYIWLGAYDSSGNVVSQLYGDDTSTELTAGTRKMSVRGGDGAYMNFAKTSNGARVQSGTIYSTTSDGGYSVRVNSSGTLFSESSSLRYKQDVATARELPSILDVEPKVWRNKSSMENHRKLEGLRAEIGEGPVPQSYAEAQGDVPWDYGAVAEEVDGLGLSELVVYDPFGRPDALNYEKFGVALIPIIKRLRNRVDVLEQQLGATE